MYLYYVHNDTISAIATNLLHAILILDYTLQTVASTNKCSMHRFIVP
jgi:hypothetical protein